MIMSFELFGRKISWPILRKVCANSGRQFAMATKSYKLAPNMSKSLIWNLLLTAKILRLFLDFWKKEFVRPFSGASLGTFSKGRRGWGGGGNLLERPDPVYYRRIFYVFTEGTIRYLIGIRLIFFVI